MKKKYIISILISLIIFFLISIFIIIFLSHIQSLIDTNTLKNLAEITKQDVEKIENRIQEHIRILGTILNEIEEKKPTTEQEIFNIYNRNLGKEEFSRIAILYKDGKTSTSDGIIVDWSEDINYFFDSDEIQISKQTHSKVNNHEVNMYSKKTVFNNENVVIILVIETEKYEEMFTQKIYNGTGMEYIITDSGDIVANLGVNGKEVNIFEEMKRINDKEIDKVEKMKVCTCLNPLHTCLAVFGCVLGYKKISDEMNDEELVKLVETVGYVEGLPVVVNPGILDPKEFIDTVLKVRVPNPFMPDTPQRIATDTSQKLAIRFGETIKAYAASEELEVDSLKLIPFVFAGWLRYLMAIDDAGNKFELSPDPLLDTVCPYVADFKVGEEKDVAEIEAALKPVLENAKIFGVNLYEVGMAEKVCGYFKEMIAGVGAVRATLKKYV